jgi:hypothetical protein
VVAAWRLAAIDQPHAYIGPMAGQGQRDQATCQAATCNGNVTVSPGHAQIP